MRVLLGVAWKFALIWVGTFAGMVAPAQAKCTRRVADPLVVARYQQCNSKKMISYLHNNIVTPYSFQCAKSIQETCVQEGCAKPKNDAEIARCQGRYVAILSSCQNEIDGAAKMAMCKDTGGWKVATVGPGRKPSAIGLATKSERISQPASQAMPLPISEPISEPVSQPASQPQIASFPAIPVTPSAMGIDPPPPLLGTPPAEGLAAIPAPAPATLPASNTSGRALVLKNGTAGTIVLKDFIGPQPAPKPLTRIESDPTREEDMGLANTLDPPPPSASRPFAPPVERRPDPVPRSQAPARPEYQREYTIEMKTETYFDMETGDRYAIRKPVRRYKRSANRSASRLR